MPPTKKEISPSREQKNFNNKGGDQLFIFLITFLALGLTPLLIYIAIQKNHVMSLICALRIFPVCSVL